LNALQAEELLDISTRRVRQGRVDKIQPAIQYQDPIERHIEVLRNAFDVTPIKARRLKVASIVVTVLVHDLFSLAGGTRLRNPGNNDDPNGLSTSAGTNAKTMAQLSAWLKPVTPTLFRS